MENTEEGARRWASRFTPDLFGPWGSASSSFVLPTGRSCGRGERLLFPSAGKQSDTSSSGEGLLLGRVEINLGAKSRGQQGERPRRGRLPLVSLKIIKLAGLQLDQTF